MKTTIYSVLLILATLSACKKQDDWLDKKSNITDVIPTSLSELQALLDNDNIMNTKAPALGMIGTDNFFVSSVSATTGSAFLRNSYKWAPDIFEGLTTQDFDWSGGYKTIEYANTVLDGVNNISLTEQNRNDYNNIKGQALFFRAISFYHLMQLFGKPYVPNTANTDLGIILKLNSDINVKQGRATVQESYNQIINDLMTAIDLLPVTALYKTRPTKIAAQALLAKVYLNMQQYETALKFANQVLLAEHTLMDFSAINSTPAYPFPRFPTIVNPEILFFSSCISHNFITISVMFATPELYASYSPNDLRKTLFFRTNADQTYSFRGRYTGTSPIFNGIAVNEIMLIQAECLARTNDASGAMNVLNSLLKMRWKKDLSGNSTYTEQLANNSETALEIILSERRKELPFTGNLRWEDLRRLNQDPRFAIALTRNIAGQVYTLPPNDLRYTYPIPPTEMNVHPVTQNLRE